MTRICIRVPNWLGDSVMARRFVTAVRSYHPGATPVLVAHARVADYWRCWPEADLVVYDPSASRMTAMWRTVAELRARGPFAAGYLLTPSLSSALLFTLAGIENRVGFASDARGWLLSQPHRYSFGRSSTHLSEQYTRLLGSDAFVGDALPELNWAQGDEKSIAERLDAIGLHDRRFVVAAVGTEGDAKRYPVAGWIEALGRVAASAPVVCVGTAREQSLTARVMSALESNVYDWSGQTDLGELAALLRCAAAFVGADSGAAHLAASLGTPTVVIFGPGNPQEVVPQGAAVAVLREPLWCSPCGRPKCPRRDHPKECLDLISPIQVAQTVLEFLRN